MTELEHKAYIFGAIFVLSNQLQVIGDKFDKNITIKQWLFALGVSQFNEPPTLSMVANHIGYSRQNAKRIASALQKLGYIKITKDPKDARALRLGLTSKCTKYFLERNQREIEFLEKVFTGFDAELSLSVYKGLNLLDQNIKSIMNLDGN